MKNITPVILAAGKGMRMYSDLPKVLHQIGGKAMLDHVIETTQQLDLNPAIIVYGHGKERLEAHLDQKAVQKVHQAQQLGTAHAVLQALPMIEDDDLVLILYADTPLISAQTLTQLIDAYPKNGIALLTVFLDDPTGYGRIVRDETQHICAIVEQKDATSAQLNIKEINTGILLAQAGQLKKWIAQINNQNAQNEFYITDVIALAYHDQCAIVAVQPQFHFEAEGINNRLQLAMLERKYQTQQAQRLLLAGLNLADFTRFDLRGTLTHGIDTSIDINVVIEGNVQLGNHVQIGAGCILKDCQIDDYSIIKPYSIIENTRIEADCAVGPFARLRPETHLKQGAQVGNFVELKKAELGHRSKANHLTYLGDCIIGQNVNIGAGTITCNYDGTNKWQTIIEDDVFVGSDSQLIAPVKIEKGATIAAGTTVTKNVAENDLVLSRTPQKAIQNWQRPTEVKKS